MASERRKLPPVAIGYAKKAEEEAERARQLSQQASEAARQRDHENAAIFSAQAEAASANARHYAYLAAHPGKAP